MWLSPGVPQAGSQVAPGQESSAFTGSLSSSLACHCPLRPPCPTRTTVRKRRRNSRQLPKRTTSSLIRSSVGSTTRSYVTDRPRPSTRRDSAGSRSSTTMPNVHHALTAVERESRLAHTRLSGRHASQGRPAARHCHPSSGALGAATQVWSGRVPICGCKSFPNAVQPRHWPLESTLLQPTAR